jgi:hypothetical protein
VGSIPSLATTFYYNYIDITLNLKPIILLSFAFLSIQFESDSNSIASFSERLTTCAHNFLGTPYDPNPIGEYVSRKAIIHDDKMDCMYFVFRCVEIALSNNDENHAIQIALNQRFKTKGLLDEDGKVLNYQERFDYADDMILSHKWGNNITESIGHISTVSGTRGIQELQYVALQDINYSNLQNGDIIFFVKAKEKRIADEIIGHLGFINIEDGNAYIMHASGTKTPNTNGRVYSNMFFL